MYTPEAQNNRLSQRGRLDQMGGGHTKAHRMLEAFFDKNDSSVRSIREVYTAVTGDRKMTGRTSNCHRMIEAVGSGTWSSVLGDSINRAMLKEYAGENKFSIWKHLVKTANIKDFRTQERVRYGGYGDLSTVGENAAYPALVTPGDEKSTYAISKRGGTETVSLEAIANDDVGAIQKIPQKLALAGQRTLAKFVLDFLKDNPAIYDGTTLFNIAHGNLGNGALSAAAVSAGRNAMRAQTEPGSDDPIENKPANLLVPYALEETAYNLFQRGSNNDRTFVESMRLNIIPVWYWTDADDWCLTGDPTNIPGIEIGFYSGNEEPEIFLQDAPISGSLFNNDQLKYKIRHIYGGAVTDYRPFYKSVVI